MGARAQVSVQEYENSPAVFIYTHWGAGSIKEDVRLALAKKWRWDDYEYLTRIMYDVIVGEEAGGETGFGIGTSVHDDIEVLVEILPGQQVRIGDTLWSFTDYITQQFTIS